MAAGSKGHRNEQRRCETRVRSQGGKQSGAGPNGPPGLYFFLALFGAGLPTPTVLFGAGLLTPPLLSGWKA